MPLVQRISRLIRADAHAVLDRIEEPDEMLRQAIRDMQSAIAENEQEQQEQQQRIAELTAQKGRAESLLVTLQSELDLCLDEDKVELARDVIRKKLGVERRLQALEADEGRRQDDLAALGTVLDEQRRTFDTLKQKAAVFLNDRSSSLERSQDRQHADVSDSDIEIALLREQRRRAS